MITAKHRSHVTAMATWLLGILLLATVQAWAAPLAQGTPVEDGIAVIYPDIGEPYRKIFMQIIKGVEERVKVKATYAVGPNLVANELNNSLRRQNIKVVIALGQPGMMVASALDSNIGVIVGGVLNVPENELPNLQVNSLAPDPALLFANLKRLMPSVRRVFAVYEPNENAWLLRLAAEAAHAQGLELITHKAQDLRSAVHSYQDIFAIADNRRDALWLPQDSIAVEESTVLPMILQESWSRSLAVFSSSYGHVRRGVLFALYSDNIKLGRRLGKNALDFLKSEKRNSQSGVIPLRDVFISINLRTAKHIEINPDSQQHFDSYFPER